MMNFEPQKLEQNFDIHHIAVRFKKLKSDGLSAPLRGSNHKAFGSAGGYLLLKQAPSYSAATGFDAAEDSGAFLS